MDYINTIPIELVTHISNFLNLKSFVLFTSCNKHYKSLLRDKPCRMILNLIRGAFLKPKVWNAERIGRYVDICWRTLIFELMITDYMTEELTSAWTRIVGIATTRSACKGFINIPLSMQIACMNGLATLSLFKWMLQFETPDKPESNRSIPFMKKLHEIKHPQTNYVCYLHSLSSDQEVLDYLHSSGCYVNGNECSVVPLTWDQWHSGYIRINYLMKELHKSDEYSTTRKRTFWNTNSFDTEIVENSFQHVTHETIIDEEEYEDVIVDEEIDTGSWEDEIFNYDISHDLRRTFNTLMLIETGYEELIPLWADYTDPTEKDASPTDAQESYSLQ